MTTNDNELWSIALPGGEIRKGTLDQLDEAFNAGAITSTTPVLAPGASEWSTLGELAGLEDAAPHAKPAPASPSTFAPSTFSPTSLRPVATDLSLDLDDSFLMPQKKSRLGMVIGTFVALGAIAFGGYTFMRAGYLSSAPEPAAAAAAAVATTVAPTPPAPPPPPSASPSADDGKPKLTDEQKKALADADKKLADKVKSKKKNRAEQAGSAPRRAGPASDPIGSKKKGGACGCNKGDPMCSCL